MLGGWLSEKNRVSKPGLATLEICVFGMSRNEVYNVSGASLDALLRVRHNVTYSGRLKCVDNVCEAGRNYWSISINQKPASLGTRSYIVQGGDRIRLSYGC